MRSLQYGAFLTQLTKYPRIFPVNCYLVREQDELTLIDANLPGTAPAILAAAATIGLPITRIVLTHAHMDHVGALDELHKLLPHAEVLISARDARFLAGDMQLLPEERGTTLRGGYQKATTTPTNLIADGDRVGSLQVVATPGHTPGHLALFDTRDGSLIAGDAFQTRAGVAVTSTMRLGFPFPALATWSRTHALVSARQLAALTPTRLAVGHGEVQEQPLAAMEAAIAEAAQA
jgi:glyoxylase-like metal-dependent hydrolase (beta-lactamase superfamily II)